jgi:hypothetical protein
LLAALLPACSNVDTSNSPRNPDAERLLGVAIDLDRNVPATAPGRFDDEEGALRAAVDACARSAPLPNPPGRCRPVGLCRAKGYGAIATGSTPLKTYGVSCGFLNPLEANTAALKKCKGWVPGYGIDCAIATSFSL